MRKICWGILGPGAIAREFLRGASGSQTGMVTAVGTRHPDRPDLATAFPGLRIHAGYDALLVDPQVDAIYIATPHPFHAEWAIKAAQANKHVLCEKPAAMNARDVGHMFASAREHGTFLGEAYMYRLHPLTARILQLLRDGKVGQVQMIRSSFGFAASDSRPEQRLFSRELGGGAILDVGGYPMSMARLIAGLETPLGFADPSDIVALSRTGSSGVDEISAAIATFPNGIIAQMSCSVSLEQDNVLHIMGSAGRLEVDSFWFGAGKYGGTACIRFWSRAGTYEAIDFSEHRNVYSFQFEAANAAIRGGATQFNSPGMTEADSIGNAVSLDRWLAAS